MRKTRNDTAPAKPAAAEPSLADLQGTNAPMTDRVNVEPPIMNGMTGKEAKTVALIALVLNAIVGGIAAFLTGTWQVMLGFCLLGTLAVVWRASIWLAAVKRGRPDGFYMQRARLWMAKKGLRRAPFVLHDETWELGRPMVRPRR